MNNVYQLLVVIAVQLDVDGSLMSIGHGKQNLAWTDIAHQVTSTVYLGSWPWNPEREAAHELANLLWVQC